MIRYLTKIKYMPSPILPYQNKKIEPLCQIILIFNPLNHKHHLPKIQDQ